MRYSRIVGTGSFLPSCVVTNADLESKLDTTHAWIVSRTGIEQRHIADKDDNTTTMAIKAAQVALETSGLTPQDIELVLVATTTPDCFFPSTACFVQSALAINNQCLAFDISAACAGFNYALSIADQLIKTGFVRHALVIGSETMSRVVDWQDRSTCILFGDGASAVLLSVSQQPGILSSYLHADGAYRDVLRLPSGLNGEKVKVSMQGREVFKVAVNQLSEIALTSLRHQNITGSEVDWFIPHQANLRIIEAVAKKIHLDLDRVIVTLDQHGNTSAASIPLALDTAIRDGRIQKGQLLLLESFGAGFVWGVNLIRY